jgi:uncharacterized lipoprotein YddW (UPF0748 family)
MPLLRRLSLSATLASLVAVPAVACGQTSPSTVRTAVAADSAPPAVPREFRAVWVATVGNMDWPSKAGLSTAEQQAELIAILDTLVALHMNAVVLQVRPAADALYQSSIEPWSDVLTGQMGRAPAPFYDPLAFAVVEAHKRGLELHAWINPYRAKVPTTKSVSSNHISRSHPELVRKYGPYLWMDPGDPAVRRRTIRVVLDIVRRYDVDGIHMDDYFYPYPETRRGREIEFPDASTYKRYQRGGGTLARDDWRRRNVDLLVQELDDSIHAVKPWVKFGVSPFGIWRPGYPASVRGLDQYDKLFADARKWLREGWVDYFTPQLYWAIDRPEQSYPVLLAWWSEQNVKERHLWPGNYTGKVAFKGASEWRTDEVLEQIRLTRALKGRPATGNVHFSMTVFMQDPDSLNERLVREVYADRALVPATPWLDDLAPARPTITMRTDSLGGNTTLDMQPASTSDLWLWVVQTRSTSGWTTQVLPGAERHVRFAARPLDVRVMAVDRVGNTSAVARVQ